MEGVSLMKNHCDTCGWEKEIVHIGVVPRKPPFRGLNEVKYCQVCRDAVQSGKIPSATLAPKYSEYMQALATAATSTPASFLTARKVPKLLAGAAQGQVIDPLFDTQAADRAAEVAELVQISRGWRGRFGRHGPHEALDAEATKAFLTGVVLSAVLSVALTVLTMTQFLGFTR